MQLLVYSRQMMKRLRIRHSVTRSQRLSRNRSGTAAVECALCIPVVVILMLGTLELCSAIYLRETATLSAYEGARVGVRRMAERQDVIDHVENLLEARNITGATIQVTPEDFAVLPALEPIEVAVIIPTAGNSTYVFDFMVDKDVTGRVTMVREFDGADYVPPEE